MTLEALARRLAEYRLARSTEGMSDWWISNTLWRDDGALPSGDRFTVWVTMHHEDLQ